jgi:integrase
LYWDDATPGLGLRVTAGGSKSYIFESRVNGSTNRRTIGSPETWPLLKAQKEARRLKALTDQKIDPRQLDKERVALAEAKRAAEEAALAAEEADARRDALLVREAWEAYLAHHARRWGARHVADHENLAQPGGVPKKRGRGLTVSGVLYPLLQLRMVDVSAATLVDWQTREASTRPNNARQGFELFRAFWRWCATHDVYRHVIDSHVAESADVRAEVPSRNNKRFDTLERAQISAWFKAVREIENPVISSYLQALLLTGARREEMAALRWQDVNFQWSSIWVKDKVAKEGRKIPLTPYLAHLLTNLKRINETPPKVRKLKYGHPAEAWQPSEWVFFSKAAANGRIAEPRIAHNRALSVAGLNHVTLHGLRRTFSNLAEWVEMPTGVVAQIMGHAPSATAERHYKSRPLDLLALWHTKYEAWILEQARVPFGRDEPFHGLRVVSAGQ